MAARRRWVQTGDESADAAGDERRKEIVEATWRLIATIGLDKTTMRRIADDVNCTTGLVTHYFASKDDLLLCALEKVIETSTVRMRDATQGTRGLVRLRNLLLAALPLDQARLLEWRVWIAFWGRAYSTPRLRKEQQVRFRRWRQAVQRALEDAIAVGDVPATLSVDRETTALVATLLGLSVNSLISGARPKPDTMIAVVDRHLASLAAAEEGVDRVG